MRVQTLIAGMLLASCCVGTSLLAQQREPSLALSEAEATMAAGTAQQARTHADAAMRQEARANREAAAMQASLAGGT